MLKNIFHFWLVVVLIAGFYGVYKPNPEGLSVASAEFPVAEMGVQFLNDTTTHLEAEEKLHNQEIFDYVLKMVAEAESHILVDMFLFNNHLGTAASSYRALSSELTEALVLKKQNNPQINIQFITDPINSAYFGYEPENIKKLAEAGVVVIYTDLTALRDSNPAFSAFWRGGLRYIPALGGQFLPNIFDAKAEKVTIPAYLRTLHFKANHRKLIVADYREGNQRGWRTLITSANPHDGSSEHGNTALVINSASLAKAVFASEASVANFSGMDFVMPEINTESGIDGEETSLRAQLLTEEAIKNAILLAIEELENGDGLYLSMFYISDRDIVGALKAAAERGVEMQLLFDANKDAFGREKNGIPNRQVAKELMGLERENVSLRWCRTNGEQCHSKLLLVESGDRRELILGSANYTRRNLDNYNLETNIRLFGNREEAVFEEVKDWFSREFSDLSSVSYETYADNNPFRVLWYRFGEATGMSHY